VFWRWFQASGLPIKLRRRAAASGIGTQTSPGSTEGLERFNCLRELFFHQPASSSPSWPSNSHMSFDSPSFVQLFPLSITHLVCEIDQEDWTRAHYWRVTKRVLADYSKRPRRRQSHWQFNYWVVTLRPCSCRQTLKISTGREAEGTTSTSIIADLILVIPDYRSAHGIIDHHHHCSHRIRSLLSVTCHLQQV
jgi:hypothetical protein